MKTWIRLYTNLPSNRKVQSLPPPLFKFWINCLAFAGQNDGELPSAESMAWDLRVSLSTVNGWIGKLVKARLIEVEDGGADDLEILRMHEWQVYQYEFGKTPTPDAERMRNIRQRKANSSRTVQNSSPKVREPSVSVSVSDSVLSSSEEKKDGVFRLVTPAQKKEPGWPNAREFFDAWKRHNKHDGRESQQLVMQTLMGRNGTVDWLKVIEVHPKYCEYWDRHGWQYCKLTHKTTQLKAQLCVMAYEPFMCHANAIQDVIPDGKEKLCVGWVEAVQGTEYPPEWKRRVSLALLAEIQSAEDGKKYSEKEINNAIAQALLEAV